MKQITSNQNEALKHLSKLLSQAKARREFGQTVLEGVHLLDAFLNAGGVPLHVFVPEGKWVQAEIQALLARIDAERVSVVNHSALSKITSLTDAEDIMTLIAIPINYEAPKRDDCVVLERVQDPGNMGTILRSAAASGVQQLVLSTDCVDIWSPKVLRAGMGAHFGLHLLEGLGLDDLQDLQVPIVVTSSHQGDLIQNLCLPQPCAWAMGHEGQGVCPELMARATVHVRIGQPGGEESLNVAAAAAICLHASSLS